jgi:hypothetical protein
MKITPVSVDADRTDPGAITSQLVFILYYRTVCYGDRSVGADRTDLSAIKSGDAQKKRNLNFMNQKV